MVGCSRGSAVNASEPRRVEDGHVVAYYTPFTEYQERRSDARGVPLGNPDKGGGLEKQSCCASIVIAFKSAEEKHMHQNVANSKPCGLDTIPRFLFCLLSLVLSAIFAYFAQQQIGTLSRVTLLLALALHGAFVFFAFITVSLLLSWKWQILYLKNPLRLIPAASFVLLTLVVDGLAVQSVATNDESLVLLAWILTLFSQVAYLWYLLSFIGCVLELD